LDEVSIQDIPPPVGYKEGVEAISALAEGEAHTQLMKKLKDGTDIVSADDPRKYRIVKDFIVKKGLKLYGGAALNMYLPRKEKIYGPYEIPDYDVYSPSPWEDAIELADTLYSHGYKYIEIRAGIHKGTYKVYANLWPVADISHMPKKLFDRMKTRTIQKFKVVSPARLIEDMYKEFSLPYANVGRWAKVAMRKKLLKKWANPIKENLSCPKSIFLDGKKKIDPKLLDLIDESYRFIQKKKLIFAGGQAYNVYMAVGGAKRRVLVRHCEALSEDAHNDIQELFAKLLRTGNPQKLVVTTYVNLASQINQTQYSISMQIGKELHPICQISQLSDCTPYKRVTGQYIVALDYLKYTLFTKIVFGATKKIVKEAKCMIKYLDKVQKLYYETMNVNEFDDTPFQRFVLKCKGPKRDAVKHALLDKWKEGEKRRKRKMAGEGTIPEECLNVPKNECDYPCVWNEKYNRCMAPPGSYRVKE
jgi:hypothetical protein